MLDVLKLFFQLFNIYFSFSHTFLFFLWNSIAFSLFSKWNPIFIFSCCRFWYFAAKIYCFCRAKNYWLRLLAETTKTAAEQKKTQRNLLRRQLKWIESAVKLFFRCYFKTIKTFSSFKLNLFWAPYKPTTKKWNDSPFNRKV